MAESGLRGPGAVRTTAGLPLRVRRRLRKAWHFLRSYLPSRRAEALFADVRTFCMFIGYPRSGHTLVGSLIDAHPNAIVANELNIVGHVKRGFSRAQIYTLILANSRAFARKARTWTGYTYAVPNQWQGRFRRLDVIGDKRGAGTVRQLRTHPELLARLQHTIGTEIRFIHVIRHPLDNISTISRRHGWPPAKAISYYFALCQSVADLKAQLGTGAVLDVWHEQVIAHPDTAIRQVCAFLGLEPDPDYVRDCAGIVFAAPRQTREDVVWSLDEREAVRSQARGFPWLRHYADES
ncbi:MAG TPA: sulfotransferase [bacterium]|nr:sulfotransferase [bacterium]